MRKIGVLSILIFLSLALSVTALSKYYSPIVSGQGIIGESVTESFPGLFDNLILGTPALANNRDVYSTCVFSGSGDNDYRYLNVDRNGIIYLTDDDFINIFDDECRLITTHIINGTLMSQPFVFDSEGEGLTNIYYMSATGTESHLNAVELVDGILILQNEITVLDASHFCVGLYCDRDLNLGTCATLCNSASTAGNFKILEVLPLSVVATVEIDSAFTLGFRNIYDEAADSIRQGFGSNFFDYKDRTFPAFYGADMDKDGHIEVTAIHICNTNDFCFNQVDLTEKSMDAEGVLAGLTWTPDAISFSSAGFGQVANIGSASSNGEMFLSTVYGTGSPTTRMRATVYNSVGSVLKNIVGTSFTTSTNKISNFAVADVNVDFFNDYCIAFNDTPRDNKTKIHCYSGLTNNIMTNCTIDGWTTDNTIHLSLLNWDTTSIRMEAITTFGIFDLGRTNGQPCNNLRPGGFTGLTSASAGPLVPVSVGGDIDVGTKDAAVDLIYYGADGARFFKSQLIQEQGPQSGVLCGAPHIGFCDNFNYEFGLIQRGWQVLERNGEINTSITPTNNRLNSTGVKFQSFVHDIAQVDVNYTISEVGEQRRVVLSFVHPVVSHIFDLNIQDNNGQIEFRVDDRDTQPAFQIRWNGSGIWFFNESAPTLETNICTGCFTANTTHSVKVTQFFGIDNAVAQGEAYPFNVSVETGFWRLYIDNELIADNVPFQNTASFDASTWIFTKNKDIVTGFAMDDVFSFRGTSQIIDNTNQFFTPIVDDIVFECQIETLFCAATSECCTGLTCFNNKCTDSSTSELQTDTESNSIREAFRDIPTGGLGFDIIWYIIMFVAGISLFLGVAKATKDAATALGGTLIFELFLLIMGTLLGFIPLGIVITLVVVVIVVAGVWLGAKFTGVSSN